MTSPKYPTQKQKEMAAKRTAEWRKNNPNYNENWRANRLIIDPDYTKDVNRKRLYGITGDQYRTKVQNQDGVCMICGLPPMGRQLDVDHCESPWKIRDLLCGNCNPGLGKFKEDPALLRAAADYLERHHPEKKAWDPDTDLWTFEATG